MTSIGIIAEYNPFHNGHLYQIKKIKEKYPDSIIVLVMSGNFTQRGDVAIIDKWKRCQAALNNNCDLIIELPFSFSCASADYFAYGAIKLLEELKVQKLVFGSESDDITTLDTVASCQINNDEFEKLVKIYSKFGYNYPTALSKAVLDLTGKKIDDPNDLLGISYIKTIKENNYKIQPEIIKRTNSYHDLDLNNEISSASAIREGLKNNINITNQIPENTHKYYGDLHFIDDYYPYIKYKIITSKDLSIYQDVDEGLDKKLKKEIVNCNSFSELVESIKTKRYTYNKICRMLIHILCSYTKELNKKFNDIKYIRILGLNKKGQEYLNRIKKDISLPIISKITREKDKMLEYEIETTKIYALPSSNYLDLVNKEFEKIIKEDQ